MREGNRVVSLAAALVLVVGMGFGRFAFTGLYPLMVAGHQISVEGGSYAASANYAGYLAGALLAAMLTGIPSRQLCQAAVIATVALLGALFLALPEWAVITVRGFAGAASAISMVAASQWLIHDMQHHHGAPAMFAGVGAGIFLSAELIAVSHLAGWSSFEAWAVLGVAALPVSILAIALQRLVSRHPRLLAEPTLTVAEAVTPAFGAARLILIYGLAGFGYIITATYLPLLVRTALGAVDPVHIWALFGLGAIPSCFLWHRLYMRWGTGRSLMLNLLVQAIGVALPALHTPVAYILSALLVGGTFMGTVTIAMPAARHAAATVRFNMLAVMTASYGVGQIIGPLIASWLYARTGSFDASLFIAAATLVVAAAMCIDLKTLKPAGKRHPTAGV